jgi:GntR family transcriptional regulator
MLKAAKLQLGPISAAAPGPLYQQVVDGIRREVAAGRLAPGTALPSFRVLAENLLVSLITVRRAYEELEREGVIYRRQGLGTFIAENGADHTRANERDSARDALRVAIKAGRQGGLSDSEITHMLREELSKKERGRS